MDKIEIIKLIVDSKLPVNDLKDIRNNIEMLISNNTRGETDRELNNFYLAITSQLNKLGMKYPPLVIYKKMNKTGYTHLTEALEFVLEFINGVLKHSTKSIEKLFIYRLFYDLLSQHITENLSMPLRLETLISIHKQFPALIERAFPGYIESNMAEKFLIQLYKEK